jgi:cyclase
MMKTVAVAAFLILSTSSRAFAQVDFSGEWGARLHEDATYRGPGPEIGEYLGLPINDEARMKADSWDASVYTMPERQCIPFAADHGLTIGNMRIWKEVDTASQDMIAWHQHQEWQAQERTIWMDGRPHPPAWAPHTWQGFSTGVWEGDTLTVTTTHLKMGQIERNGVPRSDQATLVEHYFRHGDVLTIVQIVTDPVYLTEPFMRSRNFVVTPNQQLNAYPCRPAVEINKPKHQVPHFLPGTNPYLNASTLRFKVPAQAARGGRDTMYPEYVLRLKSDTTSNPAATPALVGPEPTSVVASASTRTVAPTDPDIHTQPVQGHVYLLAGAAGNTVVQVSDDAVLVVDTQTASVTDKMLVAIRQISAKPIRFVINTNVRPEHTGGNQNVAKAGRAFGGRAAGVGFLAPEPSEGATIIAHENVLTRMSAPTGKQAPRPFAAWPTETYFNEEYELFNGEAVQLYHVPRANTDGDSLVFFRRSDVIAAGDVFSTESYPIIDEQSGGSINGVIAALNLILDLAIPKATEEGGTYVIPSHGRVSDEADVVEYRDMVVIIRDRVEDLMKKGMTLAQVKAARPTFDYDRRYSTESYTAEMFVEAVYRGLNRK